ncbi:MAG: hypothetical protein ABR958_05650 [Dehalococcoidales bacterium]|jgi:hypothetical protein
MDKARLERKEKWEREHVQHVLDYFNKIYESQLTIIGKSTEVYPELKGQVNWDWVCQDNKNKDLVAVEVKRITNSKIEEKSNIVWQILEEVQRDLNTQRILRGTYTFSIDINRRGYSPLNAVNRQKLKEVLINLISKASQELKDEEERDLTHYVQKQLPFKFTDLESLTLYKINNLGSEIYKSSGITGAESINFDSAELNQFQQLVKKANTQLSKPNANMNFLVLIEEGHRPIDPPEIEEAFRKIEPTSYSNISRVFFIRGEEVSDITLPNTA